MSRHPWLRLLAAGLLVAAACGDDGIDQSSDSENPTSTTAEPAGTGDGPLRILVTNDDGAGSEGIDALVEGLEELDAVEITVVAPAENQSGTGDSVSEPPPTGSEVELRGGHDAVAVEGFPADSVIYALDQILDEPPHVVVSGVNEGQNLGPIAYVSGTVGAARTAARRGIPALAVSQGLAEALDYESGVHHAVEWVIEHHAQLLTGDVATDTVASINVPSCETGEIRGLEEVTLASEGGDRALDPADCTSTATGPADDITAFLTGNATLTQVALDPPT